LNKLLVICGATASGKTKLAVECAKKLNTEVISADSQLIYRGLNIGTAKPSLEEMQGVRHHLIDVVSPEQNFSVSDYENRAKPIADRLLAEGKTPIICGGTGFYINSLLFSLSYGNVEANEEIRKKYDTILNEKGKEYLFELLREKDSQTAEKLHVNDTKRVIRALEIYEVSGRKKSEQNDKLVPRYDYLAVAIDYPREELYNRINLRVDKMFEQGLVEEVQSLLSSGIDENYQCMQAIGYKEVLQCLKNGENESTMRDIIKQNTRHYAKRQQTFFKKLPGIVWLKPQDATVEKVMELFDERV
jgi:tRNA dimethylallyltransferase